MLPAAWEYASYAANFREHLHERFGHVEIHRCLEPIFEDVQEGSIVLVGKQFGGQNSYFKRYEHKSLQRLIVALNDRKTVDLGRARPIRSSFTLPINGKGRPLGEILSIRVGGVTGDVNYFLMNETQRRELKLPVWSVRPVLSKARHLVSPTMKPEDWRRLRATGERVWLFDPPPRGRFNKFVNAYLRLAMTKGGCNRRKFKIRVRRPWYRTPMPRNVHGFISGMSRFGPWISFNGMAGLNATNTLYTIEFKIPLTRDERAAWALSLLTTEAARAFKEVRRVYADRLVKYEPGDLMKVRFNVPKRVEGANARYSSIVRTMLSGHPLLARRAADLWFKGGNKQSFAPEKRNLESCRRNEGFIRHRFSALQNS